MLRAKLNSQIPTLSNTGKEWGIHIPFRGSRKTTSRVGHPAAQLVVIIRCSSIPEASQAMYLLIGNNRIDYEVVETSVG